MADVNISKYRASVVRSGSAPATPGFVVSEGQNPVEPAGSEQNHLPVTINATATGLAITTDQVLSGAGTVGQYIRGDGSLADFPASTGGGSSVSYYLNGSISQGTIGGVAYKELSKTPILGAGTQFTINADGYIASFLTDAGDPNLLEIPGGNWNFETYFSASSGGGSPTFYVELYKYDGSTFTLIASNSGSPELIAFGTNINSYFSTLAVPTTALTLTDRLAIRYYVTHSGRTITLHTENNTLCQIITTFTTGLTALNGLTAQVQYFAVGTSGTDFNISSATQTHTFNLPTASASNRGALSSSDWTTFNNKQNALTNPVTGTGTTNYLPKFTGTSSIGNSIVQDAGIRVDIGGDIRLTPTSAVNIQAYTGSVYTNLFYNAASHNWQTSGGATKMFLNSNDNLLIGTTTDAGQKLQVTGTVGLRASASGSSATQIPIFNADPSGTTRELVTRTPAQLLSDIGGQAALTNPVTGTGTTNYLAKFTGSTTVGNSQVFDNGTNVGIGTSSPSANSRLHVYRGGGSYDTIVADGDAGTNTGFAIYEGGSPRYALYSNGAAGNDSFNIYNFGAAGNSFTIYTSGNVGINSSSDNGARLQVSGTATFSSNVAAGSTSSGAQINVFASSYGNNGLFNAYGTDNLIKLQMGALGTNEGFIFTGSGNKISFFSGGNLALTLNSNQTATFSSSLMANGLNALGSTLNNGNTIRFYRAGLVEMAYIGWTNENTNNSTWYFKSSNGNPIGFSADGTNQQVTIATSGNVGIGTSSPATLLQVEGSAPIFTMNRTSGGLINRINFSSGGTNYASIISDAGAGEQRYSMGPSAGWGGYHTFYTDTTERMRITSSGNVVITADAGNEQLTIRRASNTNAQLINGVHSSGYAWIQSVEQNVGYRPLVLNRDGGNVLIGTTTDNGARLQVSGAIYASDELYLDNGKYLRFRRSSGNLSIQTLGIPSGTDDVRLLTTGDFNVLNGSLTNLMTVKNGGNVLIGTTTDIGQRLQVSGGYIAQVDGGVRTFLGYDGTGSLIGTTTNHYFRFITNDTERMRITAGGEVLIGNTDNGAYNLQCNGTGVWGAGAYVNGSDRNIKDNIATIEKGLEYIQKMNPVKFRYKPNYTRDHSMQTGFIAQELQEVFASEDYLSGLVQQGVHLSVAYQNLLPVLVKAIQEQQEIINDLKQKIQ